MSTNQKAGVTVEQFLAAAALNDVGVLDRYAAQGGNIDAKGDDQRSALLIAIRSGSRDFAIALLKRAPDVGRQWENSALEAAVESGDRQLIGAVYNETAVLGLNLPGKDVIAAIESGDDAAVRRYIRQGRSVEAKVGNVNLLWKAAEAGQHLIMRLLLDAGASPDPRDISEKLMCKVAASGDVRAAELLFEYGEASELLDASDASPNRFIMAASSPVREAARRHRPAMLELLIARGADVNAPGPWKSKPIVDTLGASVRGEAEREDARRCLEILLDQTPEEALGDFFSCGTEESLLLCHAADEDADWAIEALVKRGIPIDDESDSECGAPTAFLRAAYKGSLRTIDALVAHGADVHAIGDDGRNALHFLACGCEEDELHDGAYAREDMLGKLLSLGCDLDATDEEGVSARKRLKAADLDFKPVIAAHDARSAMRKVTAKAGKTKRPA